MAEAVTLMDSITKAQRRKFMQKNRYAHTFEGLDVAPKGATGFEYYTKGDPQTGAGGNGFKINMEGDSENLTDWMVIASRVFSGNKDHSSLQYKYELWRNFQSDNVTCLGYNQGGRELCADFCGIDTPVGRCCDNGTSDWCPAPTNN